MRASTALFLLVAIGGAGCGSHDATSASTGDAGADIAAPSLFPPGAIMLARAAQISIVGVTSDGYVVFDTSTRDGAFAEVQAVPATGGTPTDFGPLDLGAAIYGDTIVLRQTKPVGAAFAWRASSGRVQLAADPGTWCASDGTVCIGVERADGGDDLQLVAVPTNGDAATSLLVVPGTARAWVFGTHAIFQWDDGAHAVLMSYALGNGTVGAPTTLLDEPSGTDLGFKLDAAGKNALVTAGSDRWSMATDGSRAPTKVPDGVKAITFTPDGSALLYFQSFTLLRAAPDFSSPMVIDSTGLPLQSLTAVSPDGRFAASGNRVLEVDGTPATPTPVGDLTGVFTADSSHFVGVRNGGGLVAADVTAPTVTTDIAGALAPVPLDGARILCSDAHGLLQVSDLARPPVVVAGPGLDTYTVVPGNDRIVYVAPDPSGEALVVAPIPR